MVIERKRETQKVRKRGLRLTLIGIFEEPAMTERITISARNLGEAYGIWDCGLGM